MKHELFPGLDQEFLRMAQEAHPDVRTLSQAVERLVEYREVRTGRTKSAVVYLRHPIENASTKIGLISWDADGEGVRPSYETVLWPVSKLMRREPRVGRG
jgi:hypothetical protein